MDRREFFRRAGLIAASGLAADQLDLLEVLKKPVQYFYGSRVVRYTALPIEVCFSGPNGPVSKWLRPDEPTEIDQHLWLDQVWYHGPLPKELENFGVDKLKLPTRSLYIPPGNTLSIGLPNPLGRIEMPSGQLVTFDLPNFRT